MQSLLVRGRLCHGWAADSASAQCNPYYEIFGNVCKSCPFHESSSFFIFSRFVAASQRAGDNRANGGLSMGIDSSYGERY